MKLAKPRIDIGFATNDAPAALAFWQNEIGLPFDHTQPIRRGYKQHRHDLYGSILKINQVYEPLPDNPPSGYLELLIARDGIIAPQPMTDPDGNRVALVPKGLFGIERIGIRLGVRDVEAHRRFYTQALGLKEGGPAGADDTGVPTLLRRLNEIGIDFKDLDTSSTSLEDIFVDLVGRAA